MTHKRVPLRLVTAPRVGHVMDAPPVIQASDHTIDYTCAHCGVVLMHAEEDQVHGVILRCTQCGSYNCAD